MRRETFIPFKLTVSTANGPYHSSPLLPTSQPSGDEGSTWLVGGHHNHQVSDRFAAAARPASVNGTVTPAVNGSPVSISYAAPPGSGGTSGTDNVTTDNNGAFVDTYPQDAGGTWTVTATFAGDSTRAPFECQLHI